MPAVTTEEQGERFVTAWFQAVLAEHSHPFRPSLAFRLPGNHPTGLYVLNSRSLNGGTYSARTGPTNIELCLTPPYSRRRGRRG
jgi:hypothetical protein